MDSNWKYTVQARNAYASSRTHDKEEKRRGIDWEGKRRGIEREEAGLGRSRERPPFPSRPSFTSGRRLLQPPARSRVWGWAHGCGLPGVGPHGVGGGREEEEYGGKWGKGEREGRSWPVPLPPVLHVTELLVGLSRASERDFFYSKRASVSVRFRG
jgi:hypothetical protein